MAIRIPTSDQSKIFLGSQQIGAVYVGANKVWPDAPTEQFTIVHTKQTGFTITIGCTAYGLVTINWGDGTTTLVNSSTAKSHTYSSAGTFTVTITGDLTKISSFFCNSQQASEITITSDCSNITNFQCYSNNLTSLDISYLNKLITLDCHSNLSLNNLDMPSAVTNIATRDFRMYNIAISSYFNPTGASSFSYFQLYNNNNLTSLDVSNITTCTSGFYVNHVSISNLTINFASCTYFVVNYNNNLTNIYISSLISCTYFYIHDNPVLDPPPIGLTNATLIYLQNNNMQEFEVDSVISNCLSISLIDNSAILRVNGANAKPSAQGYADKATLISRGWSVSTN